MSTPRLTSLRPKSVIQKWLMSQTEEEQALFKSYAARCRNADSIKEYLDTHGCKGNGGGLVSIATVYNWMNEYLPKGKEATLVEADTVEFRGIETLPLSEKQVAKLAGVLDTYNAIIEVAAETGQLEHHLGDIIKGLPAINAQYRASIVDLAKLRNASDAHMLMRAGASRFMQILLNTPNIRNGVHENWITNLCNVVMKQLLAEVDDSTG